MVADGPEVTWAAPTQGLWFLGGVAMLLPACQGQGGGCVVTTLRLSLRLGLWNVESSNNEMDTCSYLQK